ncbi:hypothetical protein GCM10011491_08600 [Brucella endophytica]|uniref:Multidrug resistance protein NorM n=1 Tax=Brucella endophytica TaxID=1963359 RepID=A0A916WB86_9HYPH|nr:MATE family efflux transporter [Brucella endophytica]GGA83408.1 hypothetical protein GCM10011491_08600 [Brucella endophytica]
MLGATGQTLDIATSFLQIVVPSTPVLAVGMCFSGILRGVGDARRAMYVTLAGGLVTAILDPLLILVLHLEVTGAAISNVVSRFALLAVGFHGSVMIHRLVRLPDRKRFLTAFRPFAAIGLSAVMTQLATPIGNAFVTAGIAHFGDEAVAGWAIVGRMIPVAFGLLFALSGAVGPIVGQNFGAGRLDRVRLAMRDSLVVSTIYVGTAWLLLALFRNQISDIFHATGEARHFVIFFCLVAAGGFLFNGPLYVANTAFNNLGFPVLSTIFNWGRATIGTLPFIWYGAQWYGAEGVVAGWSAGGIFFGIVAVIACFRVIRHLSKNPVRPPRAPSSNTAFIQFPFQQRQGRDDWLATRLEA